MIFEFEYHCQQRNGDMLSPKNSALGPSGRPARLTAPREAIMDFLRKSKKHMSAKELYTSLHQTHPGLGLSTVYRTLDLLARNQMVTKICIGDGQIRYEFKAENDHHHHLICTECGDIVNYREFEDEELRLVRMTEEKLSKKYNFKIQDHNIEYFGLCEKCK
jgi:Fur family ferric uptake transcriptional regulator